MILAPVCRRVFTLALSLASVGLLAQSTFRLAPDVPANLGGTDYTSNQIVVNTAGAYSSTLTLPAGLEIAALEQKLDGSWLIVPLVPTNLGGTDYEPRDIVNWDGAVTYSMVLDGSAVGIPDYAAIDALDEDATTGDLRLSFSVPVNLGGTEYSQNDFVLYSGGTFSLDLDGATMGIPNSSNVIGGSEEPLTGHAIVVFDIPTDLGGTTYLPGQLMDWDDVALTWSVYATDPAWPTYAKTQALAFIPSAPAGHVPDNNAIPGTPLMVTQSLTFGDLDLAWSTSCLASDTDYGIYQGTIGSWTGHSSIACSTSGATTQTITPGAGNVFFLIVPKNSSREGSYGMDDLGTERPAAASPRLTHSLGTCP